MVGGSDRLAGVEADEGAAEPDARELAVVDEATSVGLPGVGEQVEALVQEELGMGIELGGALLRGGAGTSLLALCTASCSLGNPTGSVAFV